MDKLIEKCQGGKIMAKIKYDAKALITEDDVENKFLQELFTKVLDYDINNDLKKEEKR